MRSIVCTTPGRMEFIDQLPPALEKDHAIVRVKQIGGCSTAFHLTVHLSSLKPC